MARKSQYANKQILLATGFSPFRVPCHDASVGTYRRHTGKRSLFSPLCTSWILLWRLLILVLTYQGRVRRYYSEPPLTFPLTEVCKAAQKANGGSGSA